MQIFLGHSNISIKIVSLCDRVDNITNYISLNIKNAVIDNNTITIPNSDKNCHHRIFLLKWIYYYYVKRTKHHIPKLKETLILQNHKKITIHLPKRVITKVYLDISYDNRIDIKIEPMDIKVYHFISEHFKDSFIKRCSSMQIKIDNNTDKKRMEEFLKLGEEVGFVNIFDKDKIYKVLNYDDKILQALRLFGLDNYKDKSILKRRYKELVFVYHPDRVANKDTNTINKYTRKFQHIQQAYETLKKAC